MASGLIGPAAVEFFAGNDEEKKATLVYGGGIAQFIDPEGIVYAEIDLNKILGIKAFLDPVGQYSRPDIFSLSINKVPNPHTKVINETNDNSQIDAINTDFNVEATVKA